MHLVKKLAGRYVIELEEGQARLQTSDGGALLLALVPSGREERANVLVTGTGSWLGFARSCAEIRLGPLSFAHDPAGGATVAERLTIAAVPDEYIDLSSLIGDEGYVRERLQVFKDVGVTYLNVSPVGPDPLDTIAKIKSWSE